MTGFQSSLQFHQPGGIWGVLFNVYRAQRQERIVQAEMVGLIDRAQSSLVALQKPWC